MASKQEKITALTDLMVNGILTPDEFTRVIAALEGKGQEDQEPEREKTPAEMTYEEFFSYFCQQEGKIFADILLPEGTELPEELTSFDGLNSIYLDGFGCPVNLGVYYLPQSDYDSLEDVTYGDIGIDHDHLKGANAEIRVS